MALSQLKLEINRLLNNLTVVMSDIQKLDDAIEKSNDPDHASLMIDVILDKGNYFDQLTVEIKYALEEYIAEQKKLGGPIDFSYTKLLNQILKG